MAVLWPSLLDKQVLDYKETLEGTYIVAREPGKRRTFYLCEQQCSYRQQL
ncbi:hypothetical protein MASR1M74_03610 [Lentimicrobium sp.]